MRTFALSTVVVLLLAGSPLALAQASPAPSQSQTEESQEGVEIKGFQVVDVDELKGDVRTKVDAIVASTKPEDIKSLRASIEATPQAVSALKAKGRVTAQVVAVNIDRDGILTMITKAA
jgi:hypothetical protein